MHIRPACAGDLPRLLEIYAAARRFMVENGNPTQWAGGYPQPALLEEDIRQGRLYVCEGAHGPMAVFMLAFGADPTYAVIADGRWPSDAPYATIHRLASDGSTQGIVRAVVRFCAEKSPVLRADTHADNLPMQHLLAQNGFVACGTIYEPDGSPRLAYQRG